MKAKEYVLSIVLNAFLGYLWIIFISHIVDVANKISNGFFVSTLIIVPGTLLFFEICRRVAPFNQYKFSHPINLVGSVSFALVIIVNLTAFNPF